MKRTLSPGRHGFTLIELLIVIAIIALLALIVVPRLLGAVRRAKESTLVDNLHNVRTAISQFFADTNKLPVELNDLVVADEDTLATEVPTDTYRGPYLTSPGGVAGTGIPKNPFSDQSSAAVDDHWEYDETLGTVTVPAAQQGDEWVTMGDGTPYRDL
jgi:prepilin-type N-terminal cleavage/methylation domain-containing protein